VELYQQLGHKRFAAALSFASIPFSHTPPLFHLPFTSIKTTLSVDRRLFFSSFRHLTTMGLLTLVEDRPTPAAVYNWRVYACAAVASFASCMIGYDSAFIGTTLALPSFTHEFGFSHMKAAQLATIKANIVSVYQAGAFFGSLLAYASAYFLGRRKSLWVFVIIFQICAGIMLAAKDGDLAPIYAGRVLAGVGVGACSMIVSHRHKLNLCVILTQSRFRYTFLRSLHLPFVVVSLVSMSLAGSLEV